jgi:hypothetical protein
MQYRSGRLESFLASTGLELIPLVIPPLRSLVDVAEIPASWTAASKTTSAECHFGGARTDTQRTRTADQNGGSARVTIWSSGYPP